MNDRDGNERGWSARPLHRRSVIAALGSAAIGAEAALAQRPPEGGVPGQAASPDDAGGPLLQRAGRGAVRRSLAARLDDLPLSPEDFGAVGDGNADDSDAFAAAIAEAVRRRNATIWLTGGRSYRITRTLVIPQGVAIMGPGSQGTTSGYGCSIRHHFNGDLFVWNAGGAAYAGTGGGLRNLLIVKAPGFGGGTAISLIARDAEHRPGEMLFENLLVYGEGAGGSQGFWDHGLLIDGRAVDAEGARGVRSTRWIGCRFAGSRAPGRTILLRHATHAYFLGCHVDQGGAAVVGVTLEGTNDNVHFVGAGIGGDVLIGGDSGGTVQNFNFNGKIGGRFVNQDPAATGTLVATFGPTGRYVLINKAANLRTMTNIDPGFRVIRRGPQSLRLSAQPEAIGWDAENHDRGNNMLVLTDRYQCMNAGLHRFAATIALVPARAGTIILSLVRTRADGGREPISTSVRVEAGNMTTLSADAMMALGYGDAVSVALSADAAAAGPAQLPGWNEGNGLGSWFEGGMYG